MLKAHNVQSGERGELDFLVRASQVGLKVSRPFTTERYDFIVDGRGHLSRIQVKTSRTSEPRFIKHTLTLASNRNQTYKENDFDFLAVLLVVPKIWYIIPIAKIAGKKGLSFYPDAVRGLSTYERYREAWEVLC